MFGLLIGILAATARAQFTVYVSYSNTNCETPAIIAYVPLSAGSVCSAASLSSACDLGAVETTKEVVTDGLSQYLYTLTDVRTGCIPGTNTSAFTESIFGPGTQYASYAIFSDSGCATLSQMTHIRLGTCVNTTGVHGRSFEFREGSSLLVDASVARDKLGVMPNYYQDNCTDGVDGVSDAYIVNATSNCDSGHKASIANYNGFLLEYFYSAAGTCGSASAIVQVTATSTESAACSASDSCALSASCVLPGCLAGFHGSSECVTDPSTLEEAVAENFAFKRQVRVDYFRDNKGELWFGTDVALLDSCMDLDSSSGYASYSVGLQNDFGYAFNVTKNFYNESECRGDPALQVLVGQAYNSADIFGGDKTPLTLSDDGRYYSKSIVASSEFCDSWKTPGDCLAQQSAFKCAWICSAFDDQDQIEVHNGACTYSSIHPDAPTTLKNLRPGFYAAACIVSVFFVSHILIGVYQAMHRALFRIAGKILVHLAAATGALLLVIGFGPIALDDNQALCVPGGFTNKTLWAFGWIMFGLGYFSNAIWMISRVLTNKRVEGEFVRANVVFVLANMLLLGTFYELWADSKLSRVEGNAAADVPLSALPSAVESVEKGNSGS
ncbi:hypothetical protein HDU82_008709 [Entophlyctis luteolus]|nr:hypothetical protein HDU82_008709 [Entophlyctis luteolus]